MAAGREKWTFVEKDEKCSRNPSGSIDDPYLMAAFFFASLSLSRSLPLVKRKRMSDKNVKWNERQHVTNSGIPRIFSSLPPTWISCTFQQENYGVIVVSLLTTIWPQPEVGSTDFISSLL